MSSKQLPTVKTLSRTSCSATGDNVLPLAYTGPMSAAGKRDATWFDGFRARLGRVNDERFDGVARQFSAKAGLSSTHVGQILRGETGKRIAASTIEALARAGDVDVDWLTHGSGDMGTFRQRTVEVDDRYPSRPAGARAARELGLPEAAVAEVLTWQLDSDEDPGSWWWLEQIRGEADRLRFGTRNRASADVQRATDREIAAGKAAANKQRIPKRPR